MERRRVYLQKWTGDSREHIGGCIGNTWETRAESTRKPTGEKSEGTHRERSENGRGRSGIVRGNSPVAKRKKGKGVKQQTGKRMRRRTANALETSCRL